jgi:hypothetical protein
MRAVFLEPPGNQLVLGLRHRSPPGSFDVISMTHERVSM